MGRPLIRERAWIETWKPMRRSRDFQRRPLIRERAWIET